MTDGLKVGARRGDGNGEKIAVARDERLPAVPRVTWFGVVTAS